MPMSVTTRSRTLRREREPLLAVRGRGDVVARLREEVRQHGADVVLVVDDEDPGARTARAAAQTPRGHLRLREREPEHERGPLSRRSSTSIVLVAEDDPVRDGETEAHAPRPLRGEEGIEDPLPDLLLHPYPGVRQARDDPAVLLARGDHDVAPLGHGVDGVEDEVRQHLAELGGVRAHRPHPRGRPNADLGRRPRRFSSVRA
jgi:hypothetical protein